MNEIKKVKIQITKILLLFCITAFYNCSSLPITKVSQSDFSQDLIIKEFIPAKPRYLPAIVLFEPILMDEKALFRIVENKEIGFINYLNQEGYSVYLISSKEESNDISKSVAEFDSIFDKIAYKHKNRELILGGMSLGGQAVLEYMTLPSNLKNFARVEKIFFIGTGIDYNYTNSFQEKSEKLGYENKFIKSLCKDKKQNDFCARYISFNNKLQNVDNSNKVHFFRKIPKLKKDYLARFNKTKLRLPYFFVYGKIDSISPEESIYPLFHKIRPVTFGNKDNILYEAGEANGHKLDYDHADLFLNEDAKEDIYENLVKWLQKN